MGREIKRVALDFDWTPRKRWEGYVNPHYKPCPNAESGECQGGQTTAGAWLDGICRFIVLVGEQALGERNPRAIFPHPYLKEFACAPTTQGKMDASSNDIRKHRWLKLPEVVPPTREFYDFVATLTETKEPPGAFGFGGSETYRVRRKLLKLAGIDDSSEWARCPVCKGDGLDPACKEAYEAWKSYDPPVGPGWQIWETTSEGSPVSPVCATADDLVEWLCQPEGSDEKWASRGFYGTGEPYCYSEQGCSREAAERFVKGTGWVPSAVGGEITTKDGETKKVLVSGIDGVLLMSSPKEDGA